MRVFVFLLLAGVMYAAPQDGYNYQIQQQYNPLQQYAPQQFNQQPEQPHLQQVLQGTIGQAQNFLQVQPEKQSISQLPSIQQIRAQQQPIVQQNYEPKPERPPTIKYYKEFFYLSAPHEDLEEPLDLENQSIPSLKKNIRVLFIRTPEQKLSKAAIQLVKQAMDQKTVVYVLTKQHTASELATKIQQVSNNVQSKPEVVFIKYRTPEDADKAQRQIQSQYEALDGPNHFHHEAPISTHNFVGSTSKGDVDPRSIAKAEGKSSEYLPTTLKQ